jgi:hypothetical protein
MQLANKLKINKSSIETDVKNFMGNIHDSVEDQKLVLSANFPDLIDVAVNQSGKVVFIVATDILNEIYEIEEYESNNQLLTPPERKQLPFMLPRSEKVQEYYSSDNDQKLFEDILKYLHRFSYLTENQFLIIASTVLLTYIQDRPDIHYLPIIFMFAEPARGKSRTGKAAIYISYRGIHLVDVRESTIFRFSQNLQATLFFDCKDIWKKAERNNSTDIILQRFEKGAMVPRVLHPELGAFKDTEYFTVFGPTLIATNEPIHHILGTRCLSIMMPNKPNRYEDPTPEKGLELKERLVAWRGRMMARNVNLPRVDAVRGIEGRYWDISKPLLQVCKLVYPEKFNNLKEAILEIIQDNIEEQKESIQWLIVKVLSQLFPVNTVSSVIKLADIRTLINQNVPQEKQYSSQFLGLKIKAMGLRSKHISGHSNISLTRQELDTLRNQYGLESEEETKQEEDIVTDENSNDTIKKIVDEFTSMLEI